MIAIRVTVKGEQDVPPFTRIFQYADEDDETILRNCVQAVHEKLTQNLRINVNESLTVYCYYVISELRAKQKVAKIVANASYILLPYQVMIGVAETLNQIVFNVMMDNLPCRRIVFDRPIRNHASTNDGNLETSSNSLAFREEKSVEARQIASSPSSPKNNNYSSTRGHKEVVGRRR